MKIATISMSQFFGAMKKSAKNDINFENCSVFQKYIFEDESAKKKYNNVLNLCVEYNYILNEVVPYLRKTGQIRTWNEEEVEEKYWGKPIVLSNDLYGCIDFWWILLAVNNYFNPQDFTGWIQLVIPERNKIEQIMDKEIYVDGELGVIPE